jgi:hypothetical protein
MKKIIFTVIFLISIVNFAQELNAKVTINTEQLQTLGRDNLENFDKVVEAYLNNNKFTDGDWEGELINCNFSIFFTSSTDNTYNAQVVVTSQRPIYNSDIVSLMIKIQDTNMSFNYEKNSSLYFSPSEFDPLLSFLNYYAYLIIGMDMDSYQPLGGNDCFNKASDIAVLGSNSAFSKGWALATNTFNKRGLAEDLLRSNFQQFRIDLYDYYYNGLDIMSEDKEEATKNFVKLVKNLDGIYNQISRMNLLMKVFFDTKHKELYTYLKDNPDKSVLQILKKIDPSHISTYEQGLEN